MTTEEWREITSSDISGRLSRAHMEVEHLLIACQELRLIYIICECQYSDQ